MIVQIHIALPADRTRPGTLDLIVEGLVALRSIPCLGKADNARAAAAKNRDRNPLLPYGDTPLGVYRAVPVVTHQPPHKRMGRWSIALLGVGGPARDAMVLRSGLAIHAGRGNDRLVPTFGCVRLLDRDMAMLAQKLAGRAARIEITELAGVGEADRPPALADTSAAAGHKDIDNVVPLTLRQTPVSEV